MVVLGWEKHAYLADLSLYYINKSIFAASHHKLSLDLILPLCVALYNSAEFFGVVVSNAACLVVVRGE